MNRGRLSKFISVVITGIIAMSGLPSMVLADVINSPTYYSVQSELDYEITTNITSSWINHESIDLILTNNGSETIHNWYLTFNTPYVIDNIWNGAIYETDGNGTYTITSNGWNQDIHTGESVTVGITFSSDTETELSVDPEWYLLNTQATVVDASQYTLAYTEYSAWETGFTGQLTLTPTADCQHWELSFDSNREITAVSSAVLSSEGGYSYEITHDENNMRLFANNAYNFGIQGVSSEESLTLSNVELTAVDLAYHLTDDEDGNGVPDYLDFIGGGSIVEPTPTPTPTEIPTTTPTEEPTVTPTTEPSETETPTPTEEPTPTPIIDYDPYNGLIDRDRDGLLDYQEDVFGTNPDDSDTDGDGLLDGDEIDILTNPTVVDTNGNGSSDYEEDYDGDGIHNGGEYATGTCMFAYDSDYHGINDYEEVFFYGTDPRNEDSDGDGIKDGDEVILGLNPGNNDTDTDGITDDFVLFNQSLSMSPIVSDHPQVFSEVKISGEISGLVASNTTIEDTYNIDHYCTDVYGRIGVPINIESTGHFNSMLLTISYNESVLGETDESDLGVLWFDEESGFFIIQEQTVVDTENNTITLELTHFSTYVVVDLELWNNPIVPDYSDYIYEVEEAFRDNIFYPTPRTAEEMEIHPWTWWHLTHSNMIKLATLRSEAIHSGNLKWDYEYTWLVMDNTDNDADGIADFYETNGIMGTNRRIYYSNDNSEDSDQDELTDGEERGIVYELIRGLDGTPLIVRLSGEAVYVGEYGIIPSDSQYAVINDYFDLVEPGKSISVCLPYSDPLMPDSDEDGYNDSIDAIPLHVNSNITYFFTNIDLRDKALCLRSSYTKAGLQVIYKEFYDMDSFTNAWEGIGLHDYFYNYNNKNYGDKYYYNADNVIIYAHGLEGNMICLYSDELSGFTLSGLLFSNSMIEYLNYNETLYNTTSSLPDKRIESLVLFSCETGAGIEEYDNMALDFLHEIDGIQQVIAPDTTLFCVNITHWFYFGYSDICVFDNNNDYDVLESNIDNNSFDWKYASIEYAVGMNSSRGFLLFSENSIQDLYADDVFFGVLYTMPYESEYPSSGILELYDDESERLYDYVYGSETFDPLLR